MPFVKCRAMFAFRSRLFNLFVHSNIGRARGIEMHDIPGNNYNFAHDYLSVSTGTSRCIRVSRKSYKGAHVCSGIRRKQVRTGPKVSKIHAPRIQKRLQFADSYLPKRNIAYKESPISFARSAPRKLLPPFVPEYQLCTAWCTRTRSNEIDCLLVWVPIRLVLLFLPK